MRGSAPARLIFEDCEVPEENVLEEVRGADGADERPRLRAHRARGTVGIMQACLDVALPMHEREQFGRPIGASS